MISHFSFITSLILPSAYLILCSWEIEGKRYAQWNIWPVLLLYSSWSMENTAELRMRVEAAPECGKTPPPLPIASAWKPENRAHNRTQAGIPKIWLVSATDKLFFFRQDIAFFLDPRLYLSNTWKVKVWTESGKLLRFVTPMRSKLFSG